MIKGTANWLGTSPEQKEVKKQSILTDTKKIKILESLSKKIVALESEVVSTYGVWPTSEMSTISISVDYIKHTIKKLKPVKE